jgi:hypothetical protein
MRNNASTFARIPIKVGKICQKYLNFGGHKIFSAKYRGRFSLMARERKNLNLGHFQPISSISVLCFENLSNLAIMHYMPENIRTKRPVLRIMCYI